MNTTRKTRWVRVSKGVVVGGAIGAGVGLLIANIIDKEKKMNFSVKGFIFLGLMGAIFAYPSNTELNNTTKK